MTQASPESDVRLLVIGAHPDDCEIHAGGLATIYRRLGRTVRFVSVTCGDMGHFAKDGPELARIRRAEAAAAAEVIGVESGVWDFPDARLEPTLAARLEVLREIRVFRPDLVLTHRPCDYHPDHRAVGQLVQDASYLVTLPRLLPGAPHLDRDPVVGYLQDRFQRPATFRPDAVVDTTSCLGEVTAMLAAHASQFFEWLPFNQGISDRVPDDPDERVAWLQSWYLGWNRPFRERFFDELAARYGGDRAAAAMTVEAFEISEYGAPADAETLRHLFPDAPPA